MRSRVLCNFAIGLLILCFLSGCGTNEDSEQRTAAEPSSEATSTKYSGTKIAVAYALGGKGDLSYNDAAFEGVHYLRSHGAEVKEFEPNVLDDYSRGLDLLSAQNHHIIFCVGFLYDDPVMRVSQRHNNTIYVVLDGSAAAEPNVSSVKFNAQEGSFLAGVVAGKLTESDTIGFIGGMDIPIINEFLTGYKAGAGTVNPKIVIQEFYIGSGATAFTDPFKGREVALTAIARGADVIYHASGSSGNGVIKAASENRVLAIGVDVDQGHLAPGTVVTSMLKNFDVAMSIVADRYLDGEWPSGQNKVLGVADGAVALAQMPDSISTVLMPYMIQAMARFDEVRK